SNARGNGSPMCSASAAEVRGIREAKWRRGEAPAAAKGPRPLVKLPLLGSNQDSPDPERRLPDQIFRQIVVEPRVRNVRCREERRHCRGLSGATGTETMTPKVC